MIPNKVERDLVYFFTEVFRGTNDAANKDKFRKCQCFNYVYPTNDREVWDHMFNVFFKDPNLSKKFSYSDTSRSYVKCNPSA